MVFVQTYKSLATYGKWFFIVSLHSPKVKKKWVDGGYFVWKKINNLKNQEILIFQ